MGNKPGSRGATHKGEILIKDKEENKIVFSSSPKKGSSGSCGQPRAHLPGHGPGTCEGAQPCVCGYGPLCKEDSHFCRVCFGLTVCSSVCVCVSLYGSVHMGTCCMHVCVCECICACVSVPCAHCVCTLLCVPAFGCVLCVCLSTGMWSSFCAQELVSGASVFCPDCSLPPFFLHSQSPWASLEDFTGQGASEPP